MVEAIVSVQDITFRYDIRMKKTTIHNLSFNASEGEWLAIIGPNGSGKSTLAKLLVGLHELESGSIRINGEVLSEENKNSIREDIAIVFQNPENQFIGTSVEDDVAFSLENQNMKRSFMRKRVKEALLKVDLWEERKTDPARLSGGQKQRVALAGVLAQKPRVLILDEAFVMIDPFSRHTILQLLKKLQEEEKLTILAITHDHHEVEIADRVLIIEDGMVKSESTPQQLFATSDLIELPITEKIRRHLREKGKPVPENYLSKEKLVNWLCKLSLKV
ncbi:energy-coupling factor transporter ATPase [Saliterribacillus persicus]|uniref:Energy-coupling factor transport system ATP-binding protein n=1 Tax=Saliterribacillus persicus TaxID=930114 RepID=A0A368XXM9_9BACI|nr:energy-coupling factor transporter ATPase [Saliterribacillus persicus]RCW71896.1 energy-coupling factor transport system ATP-binding protein [Saliterribacillus persicus]